MIYLDTETYEFNEKDGRWYPVLDARKFALGYAETDEDVGKFFTDRNKMYDWVIHKIKANAKRKKRTFIYGHHMEYDWYAIAQEHLLEKEMKYIVFFPFIGIYEDKGYFLDSMAFWKMSLAEVGEILGFEKLKMPESVGHLDELKEYLKRDVQIVRKAMEKIKEDIKKLGFNPRKLMTAGQLAITSFMTFCKRENLNWEFTELVETGFGYKQLQVIKPKRPKLLREAFRGGDNRAFQLGKHENCTLIDANGLYTYVMKDLMEFPDLRSESFSKNPSVGLLEEYIKNEIGVARVTMIAEGIEFPYIPIRYTKYQIFPRSGKMRGTWTFTELKKAIELGYKIENVEWCMRWQKAKVNPLSEFVKELYELEKQDKEGYGRVIKLIRNNLFGKFSQYKTNKDYEIVERWKVQDYIENGYESTTTLGNKYIMVKENDAYDPSYTNAIISIQITALARLYMYEQMDKIPVEDLLYTDTDSIMFKGNHIDKFPIGKELGEFKIVSKGTAKILGEKRYYIDEDVKISGISKRDIKKEIIEHELDVVTKKMVGLQKGIYEGKMDLVGGFEEEIQEMKPHNKLMLVIPDELDEVKVELYDKSITSEM